MIKGRLSVVIPNYNSPYCAKTIQGILDNAKGDIEVVVNVEQIWPDPLSDDPRVHYIHGAAPIGMRAGINKAIAMSTGEFVMKCDDHVMFGEGFDEILKADCEDDWVIVPRRYALDVENWKIEEREDNKYPVDYYRLDFPLKGKHHDWGIHGVEWKERRDTRNSPEFDIDETMSMQGSCYFMKRNHFDNVLGGLDSEIYGQFSQEAQEIGFKTWLSGGKLMTNKKTWYAHLHKGSRYGRFYKMPPGTAEASNTSAHYWMQNQWEKQTRDMKWLIDKFWPVPSWPDNWEEVWKQQVIEGWPNIYEKD